MNSIKPILFNTPMVQAILDGRKTQTRRPIKFPSYIREDYDEGHFGLHEENDSYSYGWSIRELIENRYLKRPYEPGDILWVRETWAHPSTSEIENGADPSLYIYKADEPALKCAYEKWRPSIHMPHEAARIFLRVTDARAERVHDITEEDARAEGFRDRAAFLDCWAQIYDKCNQWVWAYGFERYEKPANDQQVTGKLTALEMAEKALSPMPDPETGLMPCGCGGAAEIQFFLDQYDEENESQRFEVCVGCGKCYICTQPLKGLYLRGKDRFATEAQAKKDWNTAMGWKGK